MTETTAAEGTGVKTADKVFAYLAALLVLCVIVQFFLAGLGIWGIDKPKLNDKVTTLDAHRGFAMVVALVAILMFITALVSRTSKTRIWVSIGIAVLAEVVQSLLASGGEHQHWVGGLHVLDALVILGLAGWMHNETRPLLKRG